MDRADPPAVEVARTVAPQRGSLIEARAPRRVDTPAAVESKAAGIGAKDEAKNDVTSGATSGGLRDRVGGGEWERILEAAGSYRRLRVVLDEASLVRLDAERVVIAVPEAMRSVAKASERELVSVVASALGRSVAVEIEAIGSGMETPVAVEANGARAERTPADQEPLVRQAIDLFGARIVSVTNRPGAG